MPLNWSIMPGKLPYHALLLTGCSLLFACNPHKTTSEKARWDTTGIFRSIKLTPGEEKKAGLQYTTPEPCVLTHMVTCNGTLVVAPGREITVPAPAAGNINDLFIQPGQQVNTGMLVATITNTDFIALQQEWLEAKHQYTYLKDEYTRQGELTVENATSLKRMQLAQRDYLSAEARWKSLSLQLRQTGINPDSVRPERIYTEIPVYAKNTGYVSRISVNQGAWTDKGRPLFELVNNNHLQVELKIPGTYLPYLQPGQEIFFHHAFDSTTLYKAQLKNILPEVDPETGMAFVYAKPIGNVHAIYRGMPVSVQLSAGTDSAFLISTGAIVTAHDGLYVIARKNGLFVEIPVSYLATDTYDNCFGGLPASHADSLVINPNDFFAKITHRH